MQQVSRKVMISPFARRRATSGILTLPIVRSWISSSLPGVLKLKKKCWLKVAQGILRNPAAM